MLPGFRFLFAAIVLSMSMLIFGLGAAALLRAAHEEFASIPSRRPPPETLFAQRGDAGPTLAMVRVEPSAADEKAAMATAIADMCRIKRQSFPHRRSRRSPRAESDKIAALIGNAAKIRRHPKRPTSDIDIRNPGSGRDVGSGRRTLACRRDETCGDCRGDTDASPDQVAVTAPDQASRAGRRQHQNCRNQNCHARRPARDHRDADALEDCAGRGQEIRAGQTRRQAAQDCARARVTQQAPQTPADPFARPFGR